MRIFVRVKQYSDTIMAKLVSADLTGDKLCTLTYTTTNGKMLSLKEDAFDAKIISHSYADKGVIIFDKPIKLIGANAYQWNSLLTSITIPDSVTLIEDCAFNGCYSLTSVTIPNSVTSIGYWTFLNCGSLTSITIPDSVTSIGERAFEGCDSLTSVTIPDSVIYIGEYAFSQCSSLTSLLIGNSVTEIGACAFRDCWWLKTVICKTQNPPALESEILGGDTFTKFETLIVPEGCEEAYLNSDWRKYIVENKESDTE